jgi:peptidyl-prolyl cis-trans isomerase SurA
MRKATLGTLLLLTLTAASAPAAARELVDRVIAVVNKDVVLQSDLREILAPVEELELRGLSGEEAEKRRSELSKQALDSLISQRLVDQAMERAEIQVDDKEVEAAIADVASQNGISLDRLFQELQAQGMDADSYRAELKKQIRQYKFMNLEIRGRVEVDEQSVRNRYNQLMAGASPDPAWRLQRLLMAWPPGADEPAKQRIRDEATALEEQLREEKDFGEVARARSDDASTKERGGEAGVFRSSELSTLFRQALEEVEPGEVARVEAPTGVFLLRVAETVDLARKPFEELREEIARGLYDEAMLREMELWTQEERRKAHVEVRE